MCSKLLSSIIKFMNLLSLKSLTSCLSSRYEHNAVGYYMWSVDYKKFYSPYLINHILISTTYHILISYYFVVVLR